MPPRGLRARLTIAFLSIVAISLVLSAYLVVDRVSQEFETQERAAQTARTAAVSSAIRSLAQSVAGTDDIIDSKGQLNEKVRERFLLQDPELQQLALGIARADVRVRFGTWNPDKEFFSPAAESEFQISSDGAVLEPGEARDSIQLEPSIVIIGGAPSSISIEVTLVSPLTTRASRLAGITGTITFVGILAMIVAIIVSTIAAARFAKPVQLLSETATAISDGDLSARVPTGIEVAANDEMVALLNQFNLMADRLQGSMQALRRERDRGQEHLADVSHELRTPLAALRAFVDLLQDSGTDEVTRKKLFIEAGRQLERMDSLTSNILELSRFDAGIARPVFVVADMRASVQLAVEQAAAGARRAGVAVDERIPTRKVLVRHDAALVGQAVANLVANALKFTTRGGSVLVSVQLLSTGAATVTVRDTGVGISSDELPRIFDRFYRGTEGLAATSRAARATGSGLGLAIVKSIVDMHAGRIVVESLPGEGTSFALTFPADPEAVEEEVPEAPQTEVGPATLVSFGRRAAALLGEVAKTSLRLRSVLRADPPSSTVSETPASLSVAPESAENPKETQRG
ncbi:MAG: HAMP domain-containing sensor histidine kinase [Chloroflexi bacterium]|nr:HAMP domain-containing sensor histidine kinase [Chloroflexota bacterium]